MCLFSSSQFHSLNQHHHITHTEKIFQILTNTKGGTAGKCPDLAVYRLKFGQRPRLKFGQMFHFANQEMNKERVNTNRYLKCYLTNIVEMIMNVQNVQKKDKKINV